ncbi:NUDIX domain-containing protein [Saccharopolyspora sp. K220]|uniref:NUDIX domain-containing protein n=1 Tax=Saccharopolyspora soli TaxID=2926618 RepID=UPI001F580985|nr:NUDIX domain-containing protein [Saccharopolyspora soli]MCI2417393.1 NUDIX domain-containing protein [Saccharopolyspora soli]
MADRFQVVPSVYVALRRSDDGEQVLLQLRQDTGYMDGHWAMAVAGHVESGESVVEAACREAAEELGIAIAAEDLVPLSVMHRTQGDSKPLNERVDFFFECRSWTGHPHRAEPDKAADLQWFPLEELPNPTVPHEHYILQHLQTKTLPRITTYGF